MSGECDTCGITGHVEEDCPRNRNNVINIVKMHLREFGFGRVRL